MIKKSEITLLIREIITVVVSISDSLSTIQIKQYD